MIEYATKELSQGCHDKFAAMDVEQVISARVAFGAKIGQDLPQSFTHEGRRWDQYGCGVQDGKLVALCYRRKV